MTKITPDMIRSLITQEGALYVSKSITDAIGSCVVSSADAIRGERNELKALYDELGKRTEPMVIDYSSELTVDAYTVYYLPRNTLIPKVALLCCSYSEALQSLPNRIRVLDLGSGTGAVVLGLLDLFHNDPLSGVKLEIIAVDLSPNSLTRQRDLVEHVGLRGSSHQCHCVDLSEPDKYQGILAIGAPYDIVFAANIFTELGEPAAGALLENIASVLSENGVVVNVESQSSFVMRQRTYIAKKARNLGLHMYYPCPPDFLCIKRKCWMWRTDEFECPDIMVGGDAIETTKIQIAHWMIFCNKSCSVYEMLHDRDPELIWGVAAPYSPKVEGDQVKHRYEFCTESGRRSGTVTQEMKDWVWSMEEELFKRGSIIGITSTFDEIKEGWDVVSGYISY